jgi:hypothetical protein
MGRPSEFPYFVGAWLTAEQKAKLQELAQCGRWTLSQSLRELVQACEVQPMVLTVQPMATPASSPETALSEACDA